LEKTLNALSHFGAKQYTRCGGSAWRKTCKQSSFCVGVVWQIQSIVQHLAQTNKISKLASDLKDYFTIEEETKVKIKNIQYSAIGIALIFCIEEVFFTSWAWALAEGRKGGPWPANVFYNKQSYCKNNPPLTNHRSSLMCWLTLRGGLIKPIGDLGTKFFSQEIGIKFSKKLLYFFPEMGISL